MRDKILYQMLDSLRGTTLSLNESLEVALSIVAWLKLSNANAIPEKLHFNASLVNEPKRAMELMAQIGKTDTPLLQVFAEAKSISRQNPETFRHAFDLAARLNAAGVLEDFDAVDAIDALQARVGDEFALPAEFEMLLVGLANLKSDDRVYTAWNIGVQLAAQAAKRKADVYLEIPIKSPIPALLSLLSEKPFEIHYADPISSPSAIENGKPRKFDVAIAVPPFGKRYDAEVTKLDWFGRFPEPTTSGSVLAIRHLLAHSSRIAVVAVPYSLLFSTGAELTLRTDLIERGIVQAVIALPSGLLSSSNISLAVLVLNPAGGHKEIKFINAEALRYRESISKARCRLINVEHLIKLACTATNSEDSISVSAADVLVNDAQLQVGRYLLPDAKKKVHALLADKQTVALADLVTTIRPLPTTLQNENSIEAWEIGAAGLPANGYINTPGRTVLIDSLAAEKNEHQFLQPHDIILIVKGSVGKVGIVPLNIPPPGAGGWVAGQSAIILRMKTPYVIDPRVLLLQLRSPFGQELIKGIVSGSTIQLIQLRELMRLQVLIPDTETALRAREALEKEARLQQDIDALRQQQEEAASDLWSL